MTRRIVLPGEDLSRQRIELPPSAVRHVSQVLRSRRGDRLLLLDGAGGQAHAVVETISRRAVTLRLEERSAVAESAGAPLHLVQALPKGQKIDEIVRRSTELGVTTIRPCLTERSVARPDPSRAESRLLRWRRIATEASRQCRRERIPEVHELRGFEEALRCVTMTSRRIILFETEVSTGLSERLADLDDDGVTLVIGPEGGFTAEELSLAHTVGFEAASMGPRILRTETAAIVACAIAQQALGGLEPH